MTIFNTSGDVIEGAVAVFYFFVQFGELPGEGLVLLPGDVFWSEFLEDVAELFEGGLILA
jgi:hypothetical protein